MREDFFTILRKGNTKMSNIIWQQDQISYVVEQYNLHHSTTAIANQFNVSAEAIRTLLRKQHVHVQTLTELQTIDYPRNSKFFAQIDTPQKAYWLGFLYADGYISLRNEIRIDLKQDDDQHLNKFRTAIQAINHQIGYSEKREGDKVFPQAYFTIRDKEMAADLNRLGCYNNKSSSLVFPTYKQVPLKYMSHFIRGYFDGDGSINYSKSRYVRNTDGESANQWKISFAGTPEFLTGLKKVLNKDSLTLEKVTGNNFTKLTISGNNQVAELGEYLWYESYDEIELTRKKEKYSQFLSERLGDEPVLAGCENDSNVFANGETLEIDNTVPSLEIERCND